MNMIPTAPAFNPQQFVPPDQIQRFGPGQVLHMVHYDTVLYGRNQSLSENAIFFSGRPNRPSLCSLNQDGQFSDFKQFVIYAVSLQMFFNDTVAPNAGVPTAEDMYSLLTYYSRLVLFLQSAQKQILWCDQVPAGGGVTGYSNTAASFHLTNGSPSASSKFFLKEPIVITPQMQFRFELQWNSEVTGGVPFSTTATTALQAFNQNLTADKLVRLYIHGLEIRNITNG